MMSTKGRNQPDGSPNISNEFADVWSTDSVRDLTESKRKCRFPDEGDMLYYKNYTRNNCMLECVHRFIQEACDCQPYFHPSEDSAFKIFD